MKRNSTETNIIFPFEHDAISKTWSKEEDAFIMSEIMNMGINWKILNKRLSKKFKNANKTYFDCMTRWEYLTNSINSWTDNENLILYITFCQNPNNWSIISSMIPEKQFVKEHLLNELEKFVVKLKNREGSINTYVEIAKNLFLLKILWDETCPEIKSISKREHLTESDYISFLGLIKGCKGFNKEDLNKLLLKLTEEFLTIIEGHEDFDGLLHTKTKIPKYCWLPFDWNGRRIYLLGHYNSHSN